MTTLQDSTSWLAVGEDEPSWRYGAASGVLDALDGFVIPAVTTSATPTRFDASTSCPACGNKWEFVGVRQANEPFHLPTTDNRGWCRVTTDKELSSQEIGVTQDDMAFSGACLVDSIRGSAGRRAWVDVLAGKKILDPDTQISRVWAWPDVSPILPGALRPTLLAVTQREVVGVVHQPFRGGNKMALEELTIPAYKRRAIFTAMMTYVWDNQQADVGKWGEVATLVRSGKARQIHANYQWSKMLAKNDEVAYEMAKELKLPLGAARSQLDKSLAAVLRYEMTLKFITQVCPELAPMLPMEGE